MCGCIPFPDEVVQCSSCDSLICNIKSIELKTSCPNCELRGEREKLKGFSCSKINNRLITDFLVNLKLSCQFCSKVLKLNHYKDHLRMEHTRLTCTIHHCNEPIEEGVHCKKASCLIISKWLDILKDHNVNINSLDEKTIKTIEYTKQNVNRMSSRIEDMKMQIDNYYSSGSGFSKSKSRHVSFQNLMDAHDKKQD